MEIRWSLDRTSDVGRALLAATRRLREADIDSAQIDAAVILAAVLRVSKSWLYAHPDRPLAGAEIESYEALVQRRARQEPVAYLVGYKPFYGLDIAVDRRVLIPRPETELLVERVITYLRRQDQPGLRVADIGAGSGAIAVALAVHCPGLRVYAVDVSADALAVATQNIARFNLEGRVLPLQGAFLAPLPEPVDVVVANLPYVASPSFPTLAPGILNFEPALALDGGPDGLAVIEALLRQIAAPPAAGAVRPGGRVFLEIGGDQGKAMKALAQRILPQAHCEVDVDYASLDRLVTIELPE